MSPFENGSLAFSLWISSFLSSAPGIGLPEPRVGSLESQRIDLSQESRFDNCSDFKTGTFMVTVDIV